MERIFCNARFLTLDPARPEVSAVRVRDARIVEVGDGLTGGERVDLGGAVVTPGLIDAHIHLQWLGASLRKVDLSDAKSEAEAAARVLRAAEKQKPGSWVLGRGWDQNRWQPARYPTQKSLADVEAPVLLERIDTHAAWVNGAALRAAGIGGGTADPQGGTIVRDEGGEPTGVLIDRAIDLVQARVPAPSHAELRQDITIALERCQLAGLTGVHDMSTTPEMLAVFQELEAEAALPLRVVCYMHGDAELGELPRARPTLRVAGVKLFVDGALGSHGAAMLHPYCDRTHEQGLLLLPPEELFRQAKAVHDRGLQLAIHGIGDRAVRLALDAIAAAQGADRSRRHRVEHAQIVDREDQARFGALGIIPSMQPIHAASDAAWVGVRLGQERLRGAYAWRSLARHGATLAFGSDAPVESESPWLGLHAAISRGHAAAPELDAGEALSPIEALQAYTTGPAYAVHAADLGRLDAGCLADFTLVSGDPRRDPVAGLRALGTVVGGVRGGPTLRR